jgi:hypothetical protein
MRQRCPRQPSPFDPPPWLQQTIIELPYWVCGDDARREPPPLVCPPLRVL